MEIEELKRVLMGREYPEEVRIGPHQIVTNVKKFLSSSFRATEIWTRPMDKCPEYLRLMSFYEATKQV